MKIFKISFILSWTGLRRTCNVESDILWSSFQRKLLIVFANIFELACDGSLGNKEYDEVDPSVFISFLLTA